jgi:nitrite reductase (NO-forming)
MCQKGDEMSEQKISTRVRVLAIPALGAMALGVAVFNRNSSAQDATGTPVASPGASPAASPAASPSAGGTSFAVTAKDIFFDPKTLEGTANVEVTITVTNEGAATHDLTIDELNVQTPMLAPGESAEVKINAPAGDYQYYCSVPGHKEAGMVGTLTLK